MLGESRTWDFFMSFWATQRHVVAARHGLRGEHSPEAGDYPDVMFSLPEAWYIHSSSKVVNIQVTSNCSGQHALIQPGSFACARAPRLPRVRIFLLCKRAARVPFDPQTRTSPGTVERRSPRRTAGYLEAEKYSPPTDNSGARRLAEACGVGPACGDPKPRQPLIWGVKSYLLSLSLSLKEGHKLSCNVFKI